MIEYKEGKLERHELPCFPLIVVYDDEQSWQLEKHPPPNVESLALMDITNDKNKQKKKRIKNHERRGIKLLIIIDYNHTCMFSVLTQCMHSQHNKRPHEISHQVRLYTQVLALSDANARPCSSIQLMNL